MTTARTHFLAISLCLALCPFVNAQDMPAPSKDRATHNERHEAASVIDRKAVAVELEAVQSDADASAFSAPLAQLQGTHAGKRLEAALKETDVAKRAGLLEELVDDLAFEPTAEAPTPEGWPAFTSIGEIELKSYPAYRIATTDRTAQLPESLLFWRLFFHIQRNKISMTAPVEMTMGDGEKQRVEAMGFLYQSTEIGQTGTEGVVNVTDVPAQLAISIGLRGEMEKDAIADAAERIEKWLTEHANEYEPVGELRVLGYNSPSMASEKKLYEVQRVILRREPGK